ncbi:GTPase Era [Pectinatus cerevisiiphilus]|uniref:GTPase Era n=1 Tax=Pectinatus cerevisiiphilus TaxID=86956 RepID=A0A4R3K1I4_9FIRM|nr:GTPase Era [Pectinatus cerevisiiphilus]TCS75442.1 GTP-binding protein Era [Pectinatus cerevisiiphilus]
MENKYKSGFVAVIGRPNVGKSTLINSLIGQKIVIMSDKPQTTRNKILCVLTQENMQVVFIDTPGIHKPLHKLGEHMVKAAQNTLKEVDAILFVVDANEKVGGGERYIMKQLQSTNKPVILVINKIDLTAKGKLLPIIAGYEKEYRNISSAADMSKKATGFSAVIPISAREQSNLPALLKELAAYLPEGPQYFPEDMITDQPERLIIAELIREKVLLSTRDEVPHAVAVDVDEIATRKNGDVYIRATIYVERESQKRIVIGARGALLKQIGVDARTDIQKLLGSKIYMDLWVKVKKDWRDRERILKEFGFND